MTAPSAPNLIYAYNFTNYTNQYQTKKADEKQKELAQRYQDDLANALSRAQTAAGPHPKAVDTSGEGTSSFDMSGSAGPATQMVPGNRAELIKALMSHPATQPLAMQQMQADLTREQMKQALADAGYGGTQGNPMVPGAPGSSVMAGSGATPATGSPAAPRMPAGVDPLAWALMVQKGDMEGLAKLVQEGSKPSSRFISTRYGVFAADPNNPNRVVAAGGASPPGALNYQFGPDGQPTLGLLPGQAEAAGALKAAEAKGGQPFQTGMTKVPVYLPGGDQIEVTLNPVQMERYNRTGDLPPEVASSIPGYQPPAPPQPAPGARPAGFPVETPEVAARAADARMRALNGELAQQQAALANAKTPADKEEAQKNIDALNKEIGAKIPGARPVAGRSQTQAEQIRQQGQQAANTEAGKEFISEMRQNYAKLRDVPATLQNIERAKALATTEAKNFMGPFGESKLAITKFMRANLPGMANLKTEGVTSAEELQSTLFNQVMDNLKKMDASPSQYQQQVMQEAFGTLRTDPQSVPKILNVFADILRNRVAIHNETVASAEKRGTTFPYDVKVNLPQNNKDAATPANDPLGLRK